MRIGILGGTGPAGSALGARLASVGYEVVIGSRSRYRAMEAVDGLKQFGPGFAAMAPAAAPKRRSEKLDPADFIR